MVWLKCIRPKKDSRDEIIEEPIYVNTCDIYTYLIRHQDGRYYLLCGNIEQPDYLTVGTFKSQQEAERCVTTILDCSDCDLIDPATMMLEQNDRTSEVVSEGNGDLPAMGPSESLAETCVDTLTEPVF
ncbi:hypothetical protein [Methanosphaerula palustris]|uniref:Uncharacterized protein n=1 Tax=Methanosphaerula palustris (strain ATCC BAA-1556 / DSM 19958 / E1-9c) TaxID=521011 RepID=B8GJK4_METPE|nr:hypothetical protein [Methanosphaerula palustris]ACL17045.1 hypothetical protein Mpal_1738 [Methanosphaerula palustris E1-9c]